MPSSHLKLVESPPVSSVRGTSHLRQSNLAAVMRAIHYSSQISRSELASQLDLNRSTVLDLLAELEQRGLVTQTMGDRDGAVGRPSMMVEPSGKVLSFAVSPRMDALTVAVMGMGGKVVEKFRQPMRRGTTIDEMAVITGRVIAKFRNALPADSLLTGIGVAIPGQVQISKGIVRAAPSLGWDEVPFAAMLADITGLPVWLDNDASVSCVAELRFGVGRGYQNLVLLFGAAGGIGGGVVVNGSLLRGIDGYAGELGHTRISDSTVSDYSGIPGTLESLVRREDLLKALIMADADDDELEAAILERRSSRVEKLLDAQADMLGRAIGLFVNIFNPEVIALDGFLSVIFRMRTERLVASVKAHSLRSAFEHVQFKVGGLGSNVLLVGATELAVTRILDDPLGAPLYAAR
jgi:predicted NBD/HSP70 family sugar kinase